MQVTVSVFGRFHAFYLAQQLLKRDALAKLITSYPQFEVAKYGFPSSRVASNVMPEVLARLHRRLPTFLRDSVRPDYFLNRMYDTRASRSIASDSNLLVGWSGSSIHCLRRAKEMGMRGVIERGSSHMLFQQKILKEEYDLAGVAFNGAHPRIVEQELVEYEEADRIAVPSQFVKRTFLENGFEEKRLIHNPYGADLTEFGPLPRSDAAFRVIYCGALSIRKGVRYLLQAFAELSLPSAELWLVGSVLDEIKPFLRRFERPLIKICGPKPQSQLRDYYRQGNVFCMPSIEEGLALVQLQAMACGLPLICTPNTGGDDVIRDGIEGFIVPIRDLESLKQKIEWCYRNRDACREMGQAALRRVASGFTWDDYGDRAYRAYQELLGEHHARS